MKTFKNHVHYTDPESGERTIFEPGDECPKWLEPKIDPKNFEAEDETIARSAKPAKSVKKEVNYATLGKEELVALAADRGLDPTGTKPQLIKRLEKHDGALS